MSKSIKKISKIMLMAMLAVLFVFGLEQEAEASGIVDGNYELLDASAHSQILFSDSSGMKQYAGNISDFKLEIGNAKNSVNLEYSIGEEHFVFEGKIYMSLANGNSCWFELDTMNGKKSAITMTLLVDKEANKPWGVQLPTEKLAYRITLASGSVNMSNFYEAAIRPKLLTRVDYKGN